MADRRTGDAGFGAAVGYGVAVLPIVGNASEDELLAMMLPRLPVGATTVIGPGDDCAVIAPVTVVSTDLLVEGRHFRLDWSSAEQVGRRAAVQNLADIAAMGGRPTSLVVGLVLPAELPVAWLAGLADGLAAVCEPLGVGVVGGDLSSGDSVVVSVTAVGEAADPVLRSGAKAGDQLAHAGVIGRSAAGLALLDAGRPDDNPALVASHLTPTSPLQAGPLAADSGATSMIDVSDGLLRDAARIARSSGVSVDVSTSHLGTDLMTLESTADALGVNPWEWLMSGGEDHGLLATFPPGPVPEPFRVIGTVGAGAGVTVDGEPWRGSTGWDHFSRRADGPAGAQPRR